MDILVTGADGFIGSALVEKLKKTKHRLFLCASKETQRKNIKNVLIVHEGPLEDSNLNSLTKEIDVIIHCAGIAHNRYSEKFKSKYYSINSKLTEKLALSAAQNNVKKFIFLSTAGIHSDFKNRGHPINEKNYINPKSPYTKSKFEAENLLFEAFKKTDIDLIILRPPAVYGGNVKGNLKHLFFFIKNKIPLPFGYFSKNKRSYISIENLAKMILLCVDYKKRIKSTFLIANNKKFSTKELIQYLSKTSKNEVIIFKFPIKIIYFIFLIFGKYKAFQRLNNSFELDISSFKKKFNWKEQSKV